MCGISGFFGFRDDLLLKKISQQLKHRGPDGEGFYIEDDTSLLNRRLAIIDIEGGKQPIFNENRSLVVVYNGEIYNFLELKKVLENKKHSFKTNSDTEVILHAYEEWGESAFDKFNGMFAFALYNIKDKKLFLVRDHFGIKPLYFAYFDNKFIFSSEIKPILSSNLIKKNPNDKVIYRYLLFRVHDDGRETFFQHIYRVLPGEMVVISKNKGNTIQLEYKKYTFLKERLKKIINKNKKINSETIAENYKIVKEAIKKRLISEVPVGSCLSGGIDSSTIVTLINQLLKEKTIPINSIGESQKTFSAIFPNYKNDEEKFVNILLKKNNRICSYKVFPKPEEFLDDLEDFIFLQEEPVISTGPYAQYRVFRLAKNYVKVVLDGQGLDEILAGYLPYYLVYFKQLLQERKYFKLIKEIWCSKRIIFYLLSQHLDNKLLRKNNFKIQKLFNKEFLENFKKEKFNPINNNLKARLIEDIFNNSLPALLRYEDKNSMHFSIEGRVPFLDYNFLLFIFSLSDSAIINGGVNKFIIRKSMKNLLPKEILGRKNKIGFITPEYDWFFHLKDFFLEIFSSESFSRRKYFNQKEVILAFCDFLNKKNTDTTILWRIINLELWLRCFFDKDKKDNFEEEGDAFLKANKGKKITILAERKKYYRYPIKTKMIKKDDNLYEIIPNYVFRLIKKDLIKNKNFFVVVSEKIVSISQGRSFFIWEIKPGFLAKILSFFVTKTPYGIGLGSPWTMELAIKEVGVMKILIATFLSMITKFFGIKGIFYKIAGERISTIDGPTEYSVYPSNISAKLSPKDPKAFCQNLHMIFKKKLKENKGFLGVVIIDANDLGQKVLANTTFLPDLLIEKIFKDNPMGQTDERTPLTLVVF